ncbi:hypothetical protein OESDEN_23605 [Oesophagostomum dentatum]|uniref:Uncharacterized protein n=1 Tax=Oesophagostomum dentatum TaxID=61180 RepID=A0A0B1S0P4_OESDE|nr:hypothetical protein OESDEN_23605 [Oesophagostomum dentatum]
MVILQQILMELLLLKILQHRRIHRLPFQRDRSLRLLLFRSLNATLSEGSVLQR